MHTSGFHGLLILDKPGGMTSRAALDQAARWFPGGCRIGHTGTLDPLATGLLALCVGAATRLSEYVQRMSKTYRAGLLLGAHSDTDDADGVITRVEGATAPAADAVEGVLGHFIGEILQVPPAYSAAKVSGRRAYDLARRGHDVDLEPRRVRIDAIQLLDYAYPHAAIEVHCGKGTYIRSLARDIGERLGCGALVETLRRTRAGPFAVADALSLQTDADTARSRLLPVSHAVAELPSLVLADHDIRRLRQGQTIVHHDPVFWQTLPMDETEVAVFDGERALVGVAIAERPGERLKPVKILSVEPH